MADIKKPRFSGMMDNLKAWIKMGKNNEERKKAGEFIKQHLSESETSTLVSTDSGQKTKLKKQVRFAAEPKVFFVETQNQAPKMRYTPVPKPVSNREKLEIEGKIKKAFHQFGSAVPEANLAKYVKQFIAVNEGRIKDRKKPLTEMAFVESCWRRSKIDPFSVVIPTEN